jgi:hypothetical protein
VRLIDVDRAGLRVLVAVWRSAFGPEWSARVRPEVRGRVLRVSTGRYRWALAVRR